MAHVLKHILLQGTWIRRYLCERCSSSPSATWNIVIIISYVYVDNAEAKDHKPTVAIMGEGNIIKEMISYEPEATVM